MATVTRTRHRQLQRQRQRQSQVQRTETAICVVQSVLELGIAGVLERRGVFPPHFFVSREITPTFTASAFDEEALMRGDVSILKEEARCPSEGKDEDDPWPPSLSDLTGPGGTMTMLADNGRGKDGDSENIDRQRSEALLLLQWIRQGAVEALRRGKLARVVVGIYLPGEGRNIQGNEGEGRPVESFAFDLSEEEGAAALSAPAKCRRGGRDVDRVAVMKAVETMLGNIHGYASLSFQGSLSSVGEGGAGASPAAAAMTPNTTSASSIKYGFGSLSQLEGSVAAHSALHPPCRWPPTRYLTFRCEFGTPVPTRDLPPALDVSSPVFGTLGGELGGRTVLPGSEASVRAPDSPGGTLGRFETRLGGVDAGSAAGFGVRMVVICDKQFGVNGAAPPPDCGKMKEFARTGASGWTKDREGEDEPIEKESKPVVFAEGERAVARPHGQDGGRQGLFIPCVVMERRLAGGWMHYKVRFENETLAATGRQKQWVSSAMVAREVCGKKREASGKGAREDVGETSEISIPKQRSCRAKRVRYSYIVDPIRVDALVWPCAI